MTKVKDVRLQIPFKLMLSSNTTRCNPPSLILTCDVTELVYFMKYVAKDNVESEKKNYISFATMSDSEKNISFLKRSPGIYS